MEEKRKSRRRHLLAEVRIRLEGGGWIEAVLMNINRGGIGLYAMQPLKQKDRVEIRITYLEHAELKTVEEIPGVVRWVQPIGKHHAAGIMFAEKVTKRNFPVLSRCLDYARTGE